MRKRLNLRFALYMTASIAVIGVGTYFLHAYQLRRNANTLHEFAKRARDEGNLAKAADYLGRYLGLEPADINALAEFGLLLANPDLGRSLQARTRALLTLEKVLYSKPERHDIRRRVVELNMSIGHYTEARDDLKTYLVPAYPDDGELDRLLGICYEASGDYKNARECYQKSIQHAPQEIEAYTRLAFLLRRHTQDVSPSLEPQAAILQLADRTIDDMVQANVASYRVYLLRASYCRAFNPAQDADTTLQAVERDVARAQELSRDAVDVILAAAELAREKSDPEQARKLLQGGCTLHPKEWQIYKALARIETREGKTNAALDCLRNGLKNQPNQIELLWDLADLLTASGRKDEAADILVRLTKEGIPAAYRDYLDARLLKHDARWVDAARKLEVAYSGLVAQANQKKDESAARLSEEAGILLGQCYEQIGDASRASGAYNRVVARNSQSVPGRLGLAMARRAQGRLPEALDQYQKLLRLTGAPPGIWAEVARLVLLVNLDRDETQRNWDQVDQALEQAERLRPLPAMVVVLRAERWAARLEYDRARKELLEKYGEPKSRPVEIWISLAALEAKQGRFEAALALLDDAQGQCGDQVELRLARASQWLRYQRDKAPAVLRPLEEGLDQFSPEDRRRLQQGLGFGFLQAGMTAEAKDLWQRVAQEQPNDLRCRIILFDLATQADDVTTSQRWLQEIRVIDGEDGTHWRYARAAILIGQAQRGDKSGLVEARQLLAAITTRRPDWSRIPFCEARIYDLEKQFETALPLYLRAIKMGERDPIAIGRAIILLSNRGRDTEANQIASLLRDQSLLSQGTQWVAAESALRAHDTDRAIKLAQGAVVPDSKDYRDYLLLGRVYWGAGQKDKAEPALLRARELAPTEPSPCEALVQFLVVTGQKDRACAEVEVARSQLTGKSAALALARCHELVGQNDRARELYQEALKSSGEDAEILSGVAAYYLRTARFQEAQDVLQRLSKHPDRKASAWARRLWALLLGAAGDPDKFREAMAQLDNLDHDLSASADADEKVKSQRLRAQILAMQKFRRSRREAVQILEGLIERRSATTDDYVLAAQLHELVGDWPKARARYLGVLTLTDSDTPNTLAVVALSMLRHGEADVAEPTLRRLTALAPQAVGTKELRARLLHLQNQTGQAIALLQECARTGGTDLRTAGGVLEEIGQFREAEELYRSFVFQSKRPEDLLTYVYFLIRRQRLDEALDLVDQCWATCPPVAVAEACLLALAEMSPGSKHFESVSIRIKSALAQTPDQVNLLAALANLRNFQGLFSEAAELYRRVLEKNPRHAVALNNLAWLIALKGGSGDEAVSLANRAIEVAGADPSLLDTRAVAYLSLGRRDAAESAIKDLEIVVMEAPTAATYFRLAQAHALADHRKEARQAWDMAIKQGLKAEGLHPLERDAYRRLLKEMNSPPSP